MAKKRGPKVIWVCDTDTLVHVYKTEREHKCAACAGRNPYSNWPRCPGPVKYAREDKS